MKTVFDNPSLMDLTEAFEGLEHELLELEGEITPEIEERMHEVLAADRGKVDRYVWRIREWEDEVTAAQAAIDTLQEKRRLAKNKIGKLKWLAMQAMKIRGTTALNGELWKMKIQKSGGNLPVHVHEDMVEHPDQLPEWLRRTIPAKYEPDLAALRADLQSEEPVVKSTAELYATLMPRGEYVRIS